MISAGLGSLDDVLGLKSSSPALVTARTRKMWTVVVAGDPHLVDPCRVRHALSPLAAAWVGGLALVLGIPSSGCALLVGGSGGLETTACHFQGESTPCGRCVAEQCQSKVNDCCLDSNCDENLGYLDGCAASGDIQSCTVLGSGSFLTGSASFRALSMCVTSKCSACGVDLFDSGIPGVDSGSPDADSDGAVTYISCDVLNGNDCFCVLSTGTPRATPDCSTSTVPNAMCCADVGWPEPGVGSLQPQCDCETIGCTNEGTTDCFCQADIEATANGDAFTCGSGWGRCCATAGDYCTCLAGECGGYEDEVSACTPAAIGCPKGKFAVTSCSK